MAKPIAAAAPGVVRRPVKRLFRGFGVATSDFRPLPDYLIIGTHRGGTTSLYRYLQQHPCVAPTFPRLQNVKGVRYFDQNYFRGIDWYRSHFPTVAYRSYRRRLHGEPVLCGDTSPYYLFHPAAAERAAKDVPQAKIMALLRDPLERAYSHWKRERRDGTEPLESFAGAIAAEPARLAGEVRRILSDDRYYSYAHENFSYVSQGLYLDSLPRWLDRFPREQVHIELTERFLEDPQAVYDRVLRFLGLPPFTLRDAERLNVTGQGTGQGLASEVRSELTARIAPHNRRLDEYLGIRLGWDE
jgi:hypothetical protein